MTRVSSGAGNPASAAAGLPIRARMFAAFSFVLAVLALVSFWPPTSPVVVGWLVLWVGTCAATGVAILRRQRHAAYLVWLLTGLATLSAALALQSGMLTPTGIVIDILLFAPLYWFAIWYHRSRSAGPGTARRDAI
jgi:hypothetical protein